MYDAERTLPLSPALSPEYREEGVWFLEGPQRVPTMREPSRRTSAVILVLVTILCFGIVCTYGFTNLEDEGLIWRNPMFNPPTAATLRQIWTTPHTFLYVPGTYTAWWLIAQVAELSSPDQSGAMLNAWVFHSANLLMHVVASLLVLQLLRRLTRREGAALVGALLFAIHPLQTEAVAWTTGMKDTLCGVFSFAALVMYVKHAMHNRDTGIPSAHGAGGDKQRKAADSAPTQHGRDARVTGNFGASYPIGTGFLILALLAKPAAVVIPLMALIIDRIILGRSWRAIGRSLAFWFVLTIPIMIIARLVQPASEVTPPPLWARPLVAMDALGFYLVKLIAPVGLTINYGRTPQAIMESGAIRYSWIIVVVAALIVWRAKSRWLTAAALLFVAGVLPVLGLTTFLYQQFSTVADRFVYLSMLGPALVVAWILSRRWNRVTVGIATILLISLGVATTLQARVWRNRLTLYAHAVAVQPDNPAARSSYAGALIRENRIDEAIAQLEHVMKIMPNDYTRELIERLREKKVEPPMNADERR
jgi:hypothetical protein